MKDKLLELKRRMNENFNRNRYLIIGLFLLWFAAVGITLYANRDTLGKQSSGNEFFENYVELIDGVSIVETLPVQEDADVVAVKMATYARNNAGTITLSVTGKDSNTVYANETIDVRSVQDNSFVRVRLKENLKQSKDKKIEVKLSSTSQKEKGLGIYYSELKAFEDSELRINNELQSGDLTLRFLVKNEELTLFYRIVIIWVIVTFTLIMVLLLLIKPKYEVLFTFIIISFGLTFMLIITPMSVPDETVHYEYSFQLSNYMMGEKNHLVFNEEYQDYGSFAGHFNVSVAYKRFIEKINRPLSLEDTSVVMKFDIDESYKICFVPQAIGITIARLLNWNMLRTFYMGRLCNLIFYIICIYIAIKNVPVHKLLLGIMASLPIFIQQAASYSYDCYINGLSFLIIAFLLKWMINDEPISRKEFIFVFFVNLLIAPIKVVYGLFSFLFWFVPESRFKDRKDKIRKILIVTFPALFELGKLLIPLIYRIIRKTIKSIIYDYFTVHADTYNPLRSPYSWISFEEGETYSFAYVLYHPMEAIEIIFRTIRYNLKIWFYGSFGRALSGNSLILPTYLVHGTLLLLVLSALREENYSLSLKFKGVVFAFCVMIGFMTVGGMLVSWTEIDQDIIEAYGGPVIQGVQGRYFSPLLPYLFVCLNNQKVKLPKWIDPYVLYAFVIVVFEVVVYVLSYTFIN